MSKRIRTGTPPSLRDHARHARQGESLEAYRLRQASEVEAARRRQGLLAKLRGLPWTCLHPR
jgi:hypothetical protein